MNKKLLWIIGAIVLIMILQGKKQGLSVSSESIVGIKMASTYCTETDNGKDFYNKGTTNMALSTYTDYCDGIYNDKPAVKEYFCNDVGGISSVRASQVGYDCSDGKLVEQGTTPTPTMGTKLQGEECINSDECTGSDLWCVMDYELNKKFCVDLVNPSTSCTDSDKTALDWGRNYDTYGYVQLSTGRKEYDVCFDAIHLREYYCSGSDFRLQTVDCSTFNGNIFQTGFTKGTCKEGKCIYSPNQACVCGSWGSCVNGQQTRTCTSGTGCLTTNSCTIQPTPTPTPTPTCTACQELQNGKCVSKCIPLIQSCSKGECKISAVVIIFGAFFGGIVVLKMISKGG